MAIFKCKINPDMIHSVECTQQLHDRQYSRKPIASLEQTLSGLNRPPDPSPNHVPVIDPSLPVVVTDESFRNLMVIPVATPNPRPRVRVQQGDSYTDILWESLNRIKVFRIYHRVPNWRKKEIFYRKLRNPFWVPPDPRKPITRSFYINKLPDNARSVTRYTFLNTRSDTFTFSDLLRENHLSCLAQNTIEDLSRDNPQVGLTRRQKRLFKITEVVQSPMAEPADESFVPPSFRTMSEEFSRAETRSRPTGGKTFLG
jgi:hypothetical protein